MRILCIIGLMFSSGSASATLNKTLVRSYIGLACLTSPDNKPSTIFPALRGATRSLFNWAILEEEEFVRLTIDIVRDEHDAVLREGKVDIVLRQYLESLREDGLRPEDMLVASAKRYHEILQGFQEFNEE